MSLEINYKSFVSGKLPKADFIKKNYEESHRLLFEYSNFLKKTDISKIEISDGQVIMTFRKGGFKLLCENSEYRTAPLETLNFLTYEEEEVSIFNKLLVGKKNFYDIGGNIGFYAVNAAVVNPDVKIKTFEPIPKMFSTLQKNIDLNQLNHRVEAYNHGLSDSEKELSFFVYPFGGTNSSMINVSGSKDAVEVHSKVIRLDNFIQTNSHAAPDIIKCDVEGAEKLVLLGAINTIQTYKPVLFFELLRKWSAKFDYHPNEVLDILKEIGYECFVPSEGKLKKFQHIDESTTETNFFFLHTQSHYQHIKDLEEV